MKTIWNISIVTALFGVGVYLYADDDRHEGKYSKYAPARVLSAQDKKASILYQKECGACHMAYQPSLLSAASWDKTMKGLDNHFGADASLDSADSAVLQNYLRAYASNSRTTDAKGSVAIRISETASFIRKHREVSKKMVTQPEVKSFSNCAACHTKAQSGSYREREIKIPNYRSWE